MSTAVPATIQGSAASKVWHTPELVIEILSYLVRERIDLLTCSTVSKALRTLSLPLLVRSLDVPLTKAGSYFNLFEANPKLANCIQYLRIWEDDFAHECPPRNYYQWWDWDDAPEPDHFWSETSRLLGVILSNRTRKPLPLVDISLGVMDIFDFNRTLLQHNKIAPRIAALRVLINGPFPPYPRMAEYNVIQDWNALAVKLSKVSEAVWDQVALAVANICNKPTGHQQRPALRLFHIDDRGQDQNWNIGLDAWRVLEESLPGTVEDLLLRICFYDADGNPPFPLLGLDWPRLRSFHFYAPNMDINWELVQDLLDDFLHQHPHLEDIRISTQIWERNLFTLGSIQQTFPNLRVCSIHGTSTAHLGNFLSRHLGTLTELTVPISDTNMDALLPDPSVIPTLHFLCASPQSAAGLVSKGARIRHYQLEEPPDSNLTQTLDSLKLDEWLFPRREAAEAVTCFDIELELLPNSEGDVEETHILSPQRVLPADLKRIISAAAFPNLTELALVSSTPSQCDSEEQIELVRSHLAALKDHRSLRALRVSFEYTDPLPPGTVLELNDDREAIPPRLEYLTWGPDTECYRLVIINEPDPFLADSSAGTERGRRYVRFDRLPSSFRSRVDERGVWNSPEMMERSEITLFDHSRNPPRLFA